MTHSESMPPKRRSRRLLIKFTSLVLWKDLLYYNVLSEIEEKEMEAFLNELESCGEIDHNEEKVEELHAEKKVEEAKIELKMLPPHLKYVFLGDNFTKPVIISNSLSTQEETRLIEV